MGMEKSMLGEVMRYRNHLAGRFEMEMEMEKVASLSWQPPADQH